MSPNRSVWQPMIAIGTLVFAAGCDPGTPDEGDPRELDLDEIATGELAAEDVDEEVDEEFIARREPNPTAPQPVDPADDVVAEDDPVHGGTPACFGNIVMDTAGCAYERVTTSASASLRADCDSVSAGWRAVHGGCWTNSTASLQYSGPDEGSQGNFPSDGDGWTSTDADAWSCGYTAAPGGGQSHLVVALCCPGNLTNVSVCE